MPHPLSVTQIGHATTLITNGNSKFLTDPNFLNNMGLFKRKSPIVIDSSWTTGLNAILISSTSFHHYNLESFSFIPTDIPIIIPNGVGLDIAQKTPNPIIELNMWSTHTFSDGSSVTAVPIREIYSPTFPSFKKVQRIGFIISMGKNLIYFSGENVYGTHFREIGNIYKIDVALLPIATMMPHWFPTRQLSGLYALEGFKDLEAKHMIPLCVDTFTLPYFTSSTRNSFEKLVERHSLSEKVHLLEDGKSWTFPSKK